MLSALAPSRPVTGALRASTSAGPAHAVPRASVVRAATPENAKINGPDRRVVLSAGALALLFAPEAQAVGFKKEIKKRKLTPDDYTYSEDVGLGIVDLKEGEGSKVVKKGDSVTVHYDCMYKTLDVVSSRAARLLGGNRTIAEPYEFIAGEKILMNMAKINDNANGLFTGNSGPRPPPCLSTAVIGMKKGGKRSVLVDVPEKGFPKGVGEIPPGATFELLVEVLDI